MRYKVTAIKPVEVLAKVHLNRVNCTWADPSLMQGRVSIRFI